MTSIYGNLTQVWIDYGDSVNFKYINITGELLELFHHCFLMASNSIKNW
jgi:hypothetical protein